MGESERTVLSDRVGESGRTVLLTLPQGGRVLGLPVERTVLLSTGWESQRTVLLTLPGWESQVGQSSLQGGRVREDSPLYRVGESGRTVLSTGWESQVGQSSLTGWESQRGQSSLQGGRVR